MNRTHKIVALVAASALVFWIGRATVGGSAAPDEPAGGDAAGETAAEKKYTCPMHPQIVLPDPGDCPLCGMDLVLQTDDGDGDPGRLQMSEEARALAGVETAAVRRKRVSRSVRMVGKIDYDETAVSTISAWVAGRLDRLFVDYTGVPVREGDHLVQLYSPELLTAQEELLSAHGRLEGQSAEASEFLRAASQRAFEAARGKLLLYGLTEEQVEGILSRETVQDFVMLTSPTSGVVVERLLDEGAYVSTGSPIYRIARLDSLWVRLDAYERDLPWLRPGQPVVLGVEALPGETFEGTVAFIDPFIDDSTRTAKVRVNVENQSGRLKPGMFVTGVATARLGAAGRVVDRYLAGKWVSPMHPEIVKDGPGTCDVCGMALVPAEDLGLVPAVDTGAPPLVVPKSAVLPTGERAVVYIEVPGAEKPTYEGRVITLGPRAGDEFIVLDGLREGERVVVAGAFRVDSAMQIRAKPSMMGQPGERATLGGPVGVVFRRSLDGVYAAYLALQQALADDDEAAARAALDDLAEALSGPAASSLPSTERTLWREARVALDGAVARMRAAPGIAGVRVAFEDASRAALDLARTFGHARDGALAEAYCPMAFDDKGASWLQIDGVVDNPYFGAEMLRCGEIREQFTPAAGSGSSTGAKESGAMGAGEHDDAAPHEHHEDGASSAGDDSNAPPKVGEDGPSSPSDAAEASRAAPTADVPALADLVSAGLALQVALAADDLPGARVAAEALGVSLGGPLQLESAGRERVEAIGDALDALTGEPSMQALRTAFRGISRELIALVAEAGHPLARDIVVVHCPMAFEDTGADWLQESGDVANPYFGAEMLRCGAVVRTFESEER